MTGSSIFDYIHRQDHQELSEQLGLLSQKNLMPCSMSPSSKVESDDDGGGGGGLGGRAGGGSGESAGKGSLLERHSVKTSDRNGSNYLHIYSSIFITLFISYNYYIIIIIYNLFYYFHYLSDYFFFLRSGAILNKPPQRTIDLPIYYTKSVNFLLFYNLINYHY